MSQDATAAAAFAESFAECEQKTCPHLAIDGFIFCEEHWPSVPASWWTGLTL